MKKLILLVVLIVTIFTGCNSDNKTKQYIEDENRAAFNNNYDAVSKFVFDKYPNAKTILYGDLYLTQEEPKNVKMFLRPSTIDFKSGIDFINNAGAEKLKNDSSFEQLYILTANINTNGISNIKMEPFKKSDWRDIEWKWDIYNICIKTISYLSPYLLDYLDSYRQAGDAMGLITTVIMPSKVVNKEIFEKSNISSNLIDSINETVSNDKTITVTYNDGKSIVIPINATDDFTETKIKETTIDLDINSYMPIEINNTKAFLIALDFNNVIIVYKKDNEVITKKIPNTKIKSKGYEKETLIKEHEKALEELHKMVKGLQPVIEIEKDVLVQLIK